MFQQGLFSDSFASSNTTYKDWKRKQGETVENTANMRYNNGIDIHSAQFGKEVDKHASDFGLSPRDPDNRKAFENIIHDIVNTRNLIAAKAVILK